MAKIKQRFAKLAVKWTTKNKFWKNKVKLDACRGICDVPFWLLFEFDDLLDDASDEANDEDFIFWLRLQFGGILFVVLFEFWRSRDGQNSTNFI